MTREEQLALVQSYIEKWKSLLRIDDWDIHPKVVDAHELNGDQDAQVTYVLHNKIALVKIADINTFEPDAWNGFGCIEKAVIHELLHLVLAGMEYAWSDIAETLSPSAREIAEKNWELASEQPVALMTNVLYDLKGGD